MNALFVWLLPCSCCKWCLQSALQHGNSKQRHHNNRPEVISGLNQVSRSLKYNDILGRHGMDSEDFMSHMEMPQEALTGAGGCGWRKRCQYYHAWSAANEAQPWQKADQWIGALYSVLHSTTTRNTFKQRMIRNQAHHSWTHSTGTSYTSGKCWI